MVMRAQDLTASLGTREMLTRKGMNGFTLKQD